MGGQEDVDYAINANIVLQDGMTTSLSTTFSTGTHDYELNNITWTPPSPILLVNYSIVFENHTGMSYFVHVALQEKVPGSYYSCVNMLKTFRLLRSFALNL